MPTITRYLSFSSSTTTQEEEEKYVCCVCKKEKKNADLRIRTPVLCKKCHSSLEIKAGSDIKVIGKYRSKSDLEFVKKAIKVEDLVS